MESRKKLKWEGKESAVISTTTIALQQVVLLKNEWEMLHFLCSTRLNGQSGPFASYLCQWRQINHWIDDISLHNLFIYCHLVLNKVHRAVLVMMFMMFNRTFSCDFAELVYPDFMLTCFSHIETRMIHRSVLMSQFSLFFSALFKLLSLYFIKDIVRITTHIQTELNSSQIVFTVFLLFILFAASFCVCCIWGTSKTITRLIKWMYD